jgi:transposase
MATKRYRRDFAGLEQRRKQAAQLLAKGIKQAEIARTLGVSRQSVSVWAKAQETDRQAWRRKPLGYRPALDDAQCKRLCRLLVRGAKANGFYTDVWTLRRIAQLIEREFAVSYCKTSVWLVLRAMGFSCQRPTGRASQRNEQAIQQWRLERWPMLKKSPSGAKNHSLYRRKRLERAAYPNQDMGAERLHAGAALQF